jgi:enoyl-CoA hydratase/carnithine racemase
MGEHGMSEARAREGAGGSPMLREDDGAVARLILDRAQAYNALSRELMEAFQAHLDAIAADAEMRAVVIEGRGRAFSAGHDLKEMSGLRNEADLTALFSQCSRLMLSVVRLPQPVIAKVDGIAAAAGCQLVAACDLAIASTASRFATSGIKYGLFCSTPMVALSRNLPQKAAMEMLLTGDFIDAEEAWRLGLVNRVVPPERLEEEVQGLLARLLDKPAEVLALGKRAFYEQKEMGLEDAYAFATQVIVDNALRPDFEEGVAAFKEKRRPVWRRGGDD